MALVDIAGRQRLVVYLWHPTGSSATKTFAGAFPEHLEVLRALVRGDLTPQDIMGSS